MEDLEQSTAELAELWTEYENGLAQYVRSSRELGDPETRSEIDDDLESLEQALEAPEAAPIVGALDLMAQVSRHFVPVSRAVTAALRLVTGIQESVRGWRLQLRS